MSEFKNKLNSHYVTTHFSRLHSTNVEAYESYFKHYSRVYSPLLPKDKDAAILDVGCGIGYFLYFLEKESYSNIFGIDIGEEQLNICRQYASNKVEKIYDLVGFLRKHEHSFETIVSIDVFEHFKDEELFPVLDAIKNALSPHGTLILSVPNAACLTSLFTLYGDLTHCRLFTENTITQLLLSAGFVNVQLFPNEKTVIRSFKSRRDKLRWHFREKLSRWIMSEFYEHLMEGAIPKIKTINIIAVAHV